MSGYEDLKKTLTLDPIEVNLFRGHTPDTSRGRIFGGQVVGQALIAAYKTAGDLICHSLHCYFIRPGDPKIPVLYQVERARDGRSFATRRVAAIQHGEQIFNLAASFQVREDGFDHQFAPPDVPSPEDLEDDFKARFASRPKEQQAWFKARPMDVRPAGLFQAPGGPERSGACAWMKTKADLGGDIGFNQAVLSYMSDAGILEASMRPHGVQFQTPGMQCASLDHAIWFHRPNKMSDWHLYVQDSPSASGARGFTRGLIYSKAGALVASVAQEGLIRYREPLVQP
jgi:acyl-CoA thioesterase-2